MGRIATPFLAKDVSDRGVGGCPDFRRFADHSGGTVADSHGLPHFPNLSNVERSLSRGMSGVNSGHHKGVV